MKLVAAISLRFLVLVTLLLAGCATPRRTTLKPLPPPPPIPTYGGPKRVVISLSEQMLRAYDGKQLVFETRVSSGKEGKRTPAGRYRALDKERIHYSTCYDNSPMPYSVRFHGNFFLHGFSIVPHYPASHGCVRLPLRDGNLRPAQQIYDWITIGTPIRLIGQPPN